MYSDKDIKKVSAEGAIKKKPEIYFGSRGINAEAICSGIVEGALVLGASKTQIINIGQWHFVCADIDWMSVKTALEEVNEDSLFERMFAFPEWGVNSFRWEFFTKIFSDATLTTAKETKLILGDGLVKNEYISHLPNLGKWGRVIGFKFNKNA